MSRLPARRDRADSLSKTWNVAKLWSKISSSRRSISQYSAALRVIESNDGVGFASDAPLAKVNDNPAAPKTGAALLRRLRLEVSFVRDMESSPELARLPLSDRCTISWNVG
jgi:hypothetical protein